MLLSHHKGKIRSAVTCDTDKGMHKLKDSYIITALVTCIFQVSFMA